MVRREKSHEWLDKLGRESWHLELLISGFSIFLLIQGLDMAEQQFHLFFNRVQFLDFNLHKELNSYSWFLLMGAKGLLYSLVLHLFLRGLWIAAVGLRTFNRGTSIATQGYTPLFQRTLKQNTLPLDSYIIQLDKFCSNIFAFSYLILFVALCTGTYVLILKGSIILITWIVGGESSPIFQPIIAFWGILIILISSIYVLDFAFLSPFKRERGVDKIFYPFYKFLSWISLSFIYRTLYYTMMGNRISRRFLWFIIPFYFLIYLGNSLYFQTQPLIPKTSNTLSIIPGYYENLNHEPSIRLASTPSKYVSNGMLEVFIPITLNEKLTTQINRYCSPLETVHSTLISSAFALFKNDETTIEAADKVKPYLDCMSKLFNVSVDDQELDGLPFFYQHPSTTQYGLLYMIDIDSFPRGQHQVSVGNIYSKKTLTHDSIYYRPYALFPVWKL
ncbi:MAG: hypothetical protein K9I85_08690 [Saprospiraceae bacterium]|nr:hypothetical protein [Saprospiraceae bacterium]